MKASISHRFVHLARLIGLPLAAFEPLHDRARTLVRDLKAATADYPPLTEDIWFFPTLTWSDAAAVARYRRSLENKPAIHVVLRFDPPEDEVGRKILRDAFQTGGDEVSIWADTPELAAIFGEITGQWVRLIRMPFAAQPNAIKEAPPYLLYLGEARTDKGFPSLSRILHVLVEQCPYIHLRVQILADPNSDPCIASTTKELTERSPPQLQCIHGPLPTETFNCLMTGAAAVLCLHEPGIYRYRSAGIITQAISAGIPVIMRAGESAPMAMIQRNNCTDLCYIYGDTEDEIGAAIRSATAMTIRRRRHLDCRDDWDAPWLQRRHDSA
jgi:hypothetical protein